MTRKPLPRWMRAVINEAARPQPALPYQRGVVRRMHLGARRAVSLPRQGARAAG